MTQTGDALAQRDTWLKQWRTCSHSRHGFALTQGDVVYSLEKLGARVSRSRWSEIENGATCTFETARAIEKLTGIAAADFHKRSKFKPAKKKAQR